MMLIMTVYVSLVLGQVLLKILIHSVIMNNISHCEKVSYLEEKNHEFGLKGEE